MFLKNPVLDGSLDPLGQIFCREATLMLRRESPWIPVDVFEQAVVPNPMEIIGPAIEQHVPRVHNNQAL